MPAVQNEPDIQTNHGIIALDGSGSMKDKESSGARKNRAVAKMVQLLFNAMKDSEVIQNTYLSVLIWDSNNVSDWRVVEYDVKADLHYLPGAESLDPESKEFDKWDPIPGHDGTTPTGRALQEARSKAELWANSGAGLVGRRAVIYLMSDGMLYPKSEPSGEDERTAILKFNTDNVDNNRVIRIATIGYFQHPEGASSDEDQGRVLLRKLATNTKAYFETPSAKDICTYVLKTL